MATTPLLLKAPLVVSWPAALKKAKSSAQPETNDTRIVVELSDARQDAVL
jgi:hypothetical protein